ncbi:MAG: toll/interleukin-1 receptor domain-containing protein [Acidobacteriaceae bacterium]|nr:toll/interleukin-1 receptor domain-containing protein [Acidobacteriaceae bacterium]MBV9296488.1 toll/interleukin-1 receptor domain-containing protein [Acidobacteriaceae bacterium]MBV9766430.1 toll/interleukin-1 receptor domain-containing protein [Acidobacteriaceae bacterium]
MATTVQSPATVELFYSYAHSDESLCEELQKHLTALKRSGLISDWYDRKIEPGSEWGAQIHEAMERASIILLLISADFLASKYIFEVELPFALGRHQSGRAKVIPVLLRPVEWRDLPFAKLQVLPSEARPVTLWPNRDEAFSDIAGRLRELLYSERLQEALPPKLPVPVRPVTQERVLDAAIASSVVIDEPTDLVTMVRTTESGGLKAILKIDRAYSPTSEDVQSKTFELDFPSDVSGKILPATLELALESPSFDPPRQQKKIRVPPAGDSDVSVFMLTPKRAGTLRLNLQVRSTDVEIGSRALVTESVPAAAARPILSK